MVLAFEETQPRDGVPKSVVAARQPRCSVGECGKLCSALPVLPHCLSSMSASLLGQELPRDRNFITLCPSVALALHSGSVSGELTNE